MTLELLAVNQISAAPAYHTVQHKPAPAVHMGKDSLSDFQVLLDRYQSDFTWR